MKVLVVETAGNLWGSERALLDLIDSAPQIEFGVCCPPDSPIVAELEHRKIRVFPYFLPDLHLKSRWRRLQAAFGVLRASLLFRPALIHLNQSGGYRVVQFAARLMRKPVVCHVRIFEDAAYLARVSPDPQILRAMIAISRAVEAELSSHRQLDAIPVHCIYDAYASNSNSAPRGIREPKIACVGRITPIKGQELLVEAVSSIRALPEKSECIFAGDGESNYVSGLKAKSENSAIKITWLGFLRHVSPLLRSSSVLACPSHREPLGRVIFEAWDAGLIPVVFSGAGGAAEIVHAAQAGIIYGEQKPSALGEALEMALFLSDEEAERLVVNGRRWMRDNCSPSFYGKAILKLFADVIEKPNSSGIAPPTSTFYKSMK